MVTVAEFTVSTAELPTAALFERLPGVTVELERIVPIADAFVPYVWTRGVTVEEIAGVIEDFPREKPHPDLRGIEILDVVDGDVLLRLEWVPDVGGLLGAIAASDVDLVSAVGTRDRWLIEVRATDSAAVSAFQARCRADGIPITLLGLHALTPLDAGSGRELTDAQREALALAYERGYFETPREATLEEIAEELGITGQSLGSRIRRGIEHLVADALSADGVPWDRRR